MKINKVNFSYKYTKGSVESRNKTVGIICSDAYEKIIEEYKHSVKSGSGTISVVKSSLPFQKIEKLLKDFLPEPINFYIAKEKKSSIYNGCVKTIFDRSILTNYRMELPLVNKNLPVEKVQKD